MEDLKKYYEPLKKYTLHYLNILSAHQVVIVLVVIAIAITFALLRTRSFIDIPRNEALYTEEVLRINYKEIDESILQEFQARQQDQTIEVNSNFDPDRSNPFSE